MTDTTTTPGGGKTQNPQPPCAECGSTNHTTGYHENETTGYHENGVKED